MSFNRSIETAFHCLYYTIVVWKLLILFLVHVIIYVWSNKEFSVNIAFNSVQLKITSTLQTIHVTGILHNVNTIYLNMKRIWLSAKFTQLFFVTMSHYREFSNGNYIILSMKLSYWVKFRYNRSIFLTMHSGILESNIFINDTVHPILLIQILFRSIAGSARFDGIRHFFNHKLGPSGIERLSNHHLVYQAAVASVNLLVVFH